MYDVLRKNYFLGRRRILDICILWNEVYVPLPHYTCCDFDLLGSRDVIGHVPIGLATWFLMSDPLKSPLYLA